MARTAGKKNSTAAAVIASPETETEEMLETVKQKADKTDEERTANGVVNWGNEVNTLPYYLL